MCHMKKSLCANITQFNIWRNHKHENFVANNKRTRLQNKCILMTLGLQSLYKLDHLIRSLKMKKKVL